MPAYDVSLSDFLHYAQTNTKQKCPVEEFFPLSERIEMTKRICDGLLYMNKEKSIAHRDIKPRMVSKIIFFLDTISCRSSGFIKINRRCLKILKDTPVIQTSKHGLKSGIFLRMWLNELFCFFCTYLLQPKVKKLTGFFF